MIRRHAALLCLLLSGTQQVAAQSAAGSSDSADATAPAPAPAPAASTSTSTSTSPPVVPQTDRANPVQARGERVRDQRDARTRDEPSERRPPSDAVARWSLAASLESLFYGDSGYDLFDDDDVSARLGLWVGYDIAQLSPRAALGVELGFGAESQSEGRWDGTLGTELEAYTFTAAATLRFAWLSWLDPQLRASGGVTLLSFELSAHETDGFDDRASSVYGALGAGVLFHTPVRLFEDRKGRFASFNLGLLIEGGYALRSGMELRLEAQDAAFAIPSTRASLGELGLSGPYVRSSIVTRF